MKDEQNDIVKELIPRYLAGEASSEEEKQLLAWIAQTPENEHEYIGLKKVFELSEKHYAGKTRQDLPINIDSEWNHFVNIISNAKKSPVRELQLDNRTSFTWYKIAAVILLLIVSGFMIRYFAFRNNETLYQTSNNTLAVSLPDGSQVILNRQSKLSYTSDFGEQNRTVTLTGEGFFDVVRNTQKAFIINVNNAQVEVLGTSFNIRAYDDNKSVEVIVKTGVVKFSVPALQEEVKLTAGEKGVYKTETNKINSSINNDINFISWNTHEIKFEETDLLTVIETLNKTYGANITVSGDVPSSCLVTVSFDHQTLEAVLHVLETTLNLTYKINGNQIEITRAGC